MRRLKPSDYKQLKRVNSSLLDALASINTLQDSGAYIGALDHLKRLIKAKLIIESLLEKTLVQESVKHEPKEPNKENLDKILLQLLGKEYLVRAWWTSPNRAFNNNTPEREFLINKKAVIKYLLSQLNGDYS